MFPLVAFQCLLSLVIVFGIRVALHSFHGGNHVPAFGHIIDLLHSHDLHLGAVFVIDHFLLDTALEDPFGKGGLGKDRVVEILV